ncbi:MAG: hypothetical protein R3F08_04215 [Dokdonella sp.]
MRAERSWGLALREDFLYVADRGNRCVRRIRLYGGDVETVLGNGEHARLRPHDAIAHPETPISNPTDLAIVADKLYVLSASQNRSWELNLGSSKVNVLAGTGKLGVQDRLSLEAKASPSRAASPRVACSCWSPMRPSAVRLVRLSDGRVTTLVGHGLYEYGDAAGARDTARLQNPLDVAMDPRGIRFHRRHLLGKIKALSLKSSADALAQRPLSPGRTSRPVDRRRRLWVANTSVHENRPHRPRQRRRQARADRRVGRAPPSVWPAGFMLTGAPWG